MPTRNGAVHVATTKRVYKGKTYVTHLLRRSIRKGTTVTHETLGNLSHLPDHLIDLIRRSLKGETFVPAAETFRITRSLPHGHVEAVLNMIRKLGVEELIASEPSRQRDLVIAMIAERLLFPSSKLANTRHWHDTTLAEEWDVGDANEDQLYDAMDWLLTRQGAIEKKLARRHLSEGATVLYDVTSSYYEGKTCPLARFGHNRDGKNGCPIIVYGVLTDVDGRPVAVQVYPGNTGDPTTVPDQIETLTKRFGLSRVVLVGDRGMLTQTQIDVLKKYPALGWISALRSGAIRRPLAEGHLIRPDLEAERLAEISSPEFPGERLVACYNPQLAVQRRQKREALMAATQAELEELAASVRRPTARPETAAAIGVRVGKIINHYKMAKHFKMTIIDGHLEWSRMETEIQNEEQLDGIYVIRTSEPAERLTAADGVRSYKRLTLVEQAFRCLKGIDLLVRPIHHRVADRVRAHILLCLLAYYVEWHLRRAWEPLLFEDEELAVDRPRRDPVAPARASESAKRKKWTHATSEGLPVQSFRTLLAHLGTRCRNTCVVTGAPSQASFRQVTEADALQAEALRLIEV
ncbi:Transposase [Singulisphaera sp. GP187]|uniref:IS1634 family transposase n=1 Tax=Singulisphaera sp. GP187 TaxID=1882752 RepID=UPI00092928A9|nr:IS1634 family transposase [Singulisphaera sp. GP187]SIN68807.1 Transposase [Singulisphaera sp. GP187]